MESSSTHCKLKIRSEISKTPPFLVNFSNGNVNFDSSNSLKIASYRHLDDKEIVGSKGKRILMASNGRLNYESATTPNSDFSSNKFRYYIGVRSKNSKKMKVYDTISFHLQQARATDLKSSTTKERNIVERLEDLTASFGSKDKKRSMNARQKYSTDAASLDGALKDMSFDESLSTASHSASVHSTPGNIEYIPPQNRDAQSLDEVYKITDIISQEEDEFLNASVGELLKNLPTCLNQWKKDSMYCEYVLKHLEDGVDSVKAKYLLYYNYLVKFTQLRANDIKKRDPTPEIPEPIKSYFLDRFTASSITENGRIVRSFPTIMKDKLLAYILVLALFIDGYSVNLASVQGDLKYGTPKMSNIAEVLGCYVTRHKVGNSSMHFAELKLPLFVKQKYFKKF